MTPKFILIGLASGILFGIMDGLVNANPLATRLFAAYKPIARSTFNLQAGIVIDLAYGFILAGVFLLLYRSLPGEAGIVKGVSFGLLIWFFRVVMNAASQWMMFAIPAASIVYTTVAGLGEMLILGLLYGMTLRP